MRGSFYRRILKQVLPAHKLKYLLRMRTSLFKLIATPKQVKSCYSMGQGSSGYRQHISTISCLILSLNFKLHFSFVNTWACLKHTHSQFPASGSYKIGPKVSFLFTRLEMPVGYFFHLFIIFLPIFNLFIPLSSTKPHFLLIWFPRSKSHC